MLLIDLGGPSGAGLRAPLHGAGLAIGACSEVRAGLAAFLAWLPDLIVVEIGGAGAGVLELVEGIRAISDVPLILVGEGEAADAVVARARGIGVDRVLGPEHAREALGAVAVELLASRSPSARAGSSASQAAPLTVARARQRARDALRRELEHQLSACQGNLAEVGRRMGKDRSTIRYHLRRFGMLTDDGSGPSAASSLPLERRETPWPIRSGVARSRGPADAQSSPISRLKA